MSDTPDAFEGFAGRDDARRSALTVLASLAQEPDMADLMRARLDAPVLVRTIAGAPSYWLVPLDLDDRTVGFVRVTATGAVGAIGRYGGRSALDLDTDAVVARAAGSVGDAQIVAGPTLVHDGPPGREAWMLVVSAGGGEERHLFVTPAGLYERGVGDERSSAIE